MSSASNAASVVACAAVVGATNDWLANSSVFFDMLLFKGTAVSGNDRESTVVAARSAEAAIAGRLATIVEEVVVVGFETAEGVSERDFGRTTLLVVDCTSG